MLDMAWTWIGLCQISVSQRLVLLPGLVHKPPGHDLQLFILCWRDADAEHDRPVSSLGKTLGSHGGGQWQPQKQATGHLLEP